MLARAHHDYKRAGTSGPYAALDLATGRESGLSHARHRAFEFDAHHHSSFTAAARGSLRSPPLMGVGARASGQHFCVDVACADRSRGQASGVFVTVSCRRGAGTGVDSAAGVPGGRREAGGMRRSPVWFRGVWAAGLLGCCRARIASMDIRTEARSLRRSSPRSR
jgi:hypothetical protein